MQSSGLNRIGRTIWLWALPLLVPVAAGAQGVTPSSIQVRVADAANVPIAGADVRVTRRDRNETIAGRTTDNSGGALLRTRVPIDSLELEVRHVGFIFTRRLVVIDSAHPVIEIRLARLQLRMDTVRTVERPLPQDKQPVVDSMEIKASSRPIFDLEDVFKKLRPGMFYQIFGRCPRTRTSQLRFYVNDVYVPSFDLKYVLRQTHGDHIAEVRFVICFDKALKDSDHPQAPHLYVTLKPGFTFNLKRGSYAVGADEKAKAASPRYAGFAGRLVGVFDEVSGQPIEGATVTDLLSRESAVTSRTGDLTLFFVDSSGGLIRIEKLGYSPLVMQIDNARGARDLTITLTPRSQGLVATKVSKSLADTSGKLDAVGFYDRRDDWTASKSLFFSAGEIADIGAVSRFLALTQRAECERDVRVDGAPVAQDSSGSYRSLDAFLKPDMIAGAEVYGREVPAEIAALGNTSAGKAGSDGRCMTFIWTR